MREFDYERAYDHRAALLVLTLRALSRRRDQSRRPG